MQIPQTVIVIGPKHTPHGVEWAVAPHATWSIPGATLASDPELARQLGRRRFPAWQLDAAAHAQEHAIEVELPFIARLAPQTEGGGHCHWRRRSGSLPPVRRRAGRTSSASLPEPPLLVISSDMNHFASDAENRRLDEMALAAMETLDAGAALSAP